MSPVRPQSLPPPPPGFRLYQSWQDILEAREMFPYQHMLLRAWEDMELSGVLTLNGVPTVYVRDSHTPVSAASAATAHREFWNQGIATVLLLRDPHKVRIFSSMTTPVDSTTVTDEEIDAQLVDLAYLHQETDV